MTINAPAALLLLLYELVAEQQGVPGSALPWHRPERHPQGVHRARELHLPAAPFDALDDRSLRLLRGADPALEHDLDLGLPHPRGGLDSGAGARIHARERDRLLRGGGRSGTLARRVRRPALLLLQRPQRLLPGGRKVPGRPHPLGADHARPLRRPDDRRPRRFASTPRRAARRSRPNNPRTTSSELPCRHSRRSAAARSHFTRTASTRRSRFRASMRPRSRSARSRC